MIVNFRQKMHPIRKLKLDLMNIDYKEAKKQK